MDYSPPKARHSASSKISRKDQNFNREYYLPTRGQKHRQGASRERYQNQVDTREYRGGRKMIIPKNKTKKRFEYGNGQ
jgi:hypothetical protein